MLHHTVRGVWGLPILRFFEAGGGPVALGFMAVAFIPVAIGLHSYHLFPWADPSHVDEIIRAKQWWLNEPRFLAFAALYFAIWIGFAAYLRRSSVLQASLDLFLEEWERRPGRPRRLPKISRTRP